MHLVLTAVLAFVASLGFIGSAHAVDVSAALTEITDAGTSLAAVGGAILVLAGISLAYRWVKASFF